MEEKINNAQFRFLSEMVDTCIEMFLKGSSVDECLQAINTLSEKYKNKLSQDIILELLKQSESLFLIYFNMLDEFNEIKELDEKRDSDINFICTRYIELREGIIHVTKNIISNYYLDLEKRIIRQLQTIGKEYNLYEEEEISKKNKM